jgi:hypothetical protein
MSVAAQGAGSGSIEPYSSRGGSTIVTNFATQATTVRQTLDGTAIDGVLTAIGPTWGHQPFYGTSAAAPHAAAIAGLIKQVNPSLTPAQVAQIMADTATDFVAYGVGYDTTSGAGLYNALDAAYKAYTPAQVDLIAASDSNITTDNVTNDTTPTFTGTVPAGSYVTLYVDGVANQTVQLAAGVTTYNLTTTALTNATHAITIKVASSSSVAAANFSNASTGLNVTIDNIAPAAPSTPNLADASDSGVSSTDNITNINQPTFTGTTESGATMTLFANGASIGSGSSNGSYSLSPTNAMADGSYSVTAKAMDLAGNLSSASSALNPVKIDTTAPVIGQMSFDPNQSLMTVFVPFSEDVTGGIANNTLNVLNVDTNVPLAGGVQSLVFDVATKTARYTFNGIPPHAMLPDANWQATMPMANTIDIAGNHPTSDGSVGFFFLDADANLDSTVNALDFNALANGFGQPNRNFSQGDFNYDGSGNSVDFSALATRFNSTLPSPSLPLENAVPGGAVETMSLFSTGKPISAVASDVLI